MLTHAKSMLISPADVAIEHLFPPYSPEEKRRAQIVELDAKIETLASVA